MPSASSNYDKDMKSKIFLLAILLSFLFAEVSFAENNDVQYQTDPYQQLAIKQNELAQLINADRIDVIKINRITSEIASIEQSIATSTGCGQPIKT